MNRRATSLAALAALFALVSSLFVGATVAPAGAVVREVTTAYSCSVPFVGTAQASGHVRVNLPRRVTLGDRLAARPITVEVVIPEDMVDTMRDNDIESVEAVSDDATNRLKRRGLPIVRKPIRDLAVPNTAVPASGSMSLTGTGQAAGHTFRKAGRWNVLVPKAFTADVTAHFTSGSDMTVTMSCQLVAGQPAHLATIRVVR